MEFVEFADLEMEIPTDGIYSLQGSVLVGSDVFG